MFIDMIPFLEIFVLSYFVVINTLYLGFTVTAFFDLLGYHRRVGRRRYQTLLSDTTYRPVSILVPAYNEEMTVVSSVRSLLRLGYPEFEIVVINDGSTDDTLELLRRSFGLFPVPQATRVQLKTRPVRRVYRSVDHPNLVVVDKENGGKSDALNAGINVSSFPLFCSIDADSLLESEALLRIARAFAEDDRIVAAGGIIRVLNGTVVEEGKVVEARAPSRPMLLAQSVEYVRGFLAGRAALAKINSLLIIAGAFGLFRKSAVLEVGGYRVDTVCEDMEIVMRLHRHSHEKDLGQRIIFVPDPVCWTQVPTDWRSLLRQRDRWQRGLLESLWMHKKMFLNPKYGTVGLVAMPFYVLFEALGPIVEIGGYLFVLALFLLGLLNYPFAVLFLILAVLYGMFLSIGALNIDDLLFRRYARARDLLKMMGGAVVEFLGFRQLLALTRALGFITVFQPRRGWGLMRRSEIGEPEEEPERETEAA